MKTTLFFLLLMTAALISNAQAAMTNASVIKMVKGGLDSEIILTSIEASTGKYDVSPEGLVSLKNAGVPSTVVRAMIVKMQPREKAEASPAVSAKTPEPETLNAVYGYNKSGKATKGLEKATGLLKAKINPLGPTSNTCEVQGDKSPVRLSAEEAASFLINTGGASPDALHLYKLKSSKKARSVTLSKVSTFGKQSGAEGGIEVDIKAVKSALFEIAPKAKLASGEYFFIVKEVNYTSSLNVDVYAFGID